MNPGKKSILDGKFVFKSKDVVVCTICSKEFKFHRSFSTLKYHLRNKHPFVDMQLSSKTDRQEVSYVQKVPSLRQRRIDEIGKQMSKDKYEKITKFLACWIARDGRPINIVSDEGLQDVIRVASDDNSYTLPAHRTINSRIAELFQQTKNKILVFHDFYFIFKFST